MGLGSAMCFRLARRRLLARRAGEAGENPSSFDPAAYRARRDADLREQFEQNFRADDVRGLDVVDFGCGSGELSYLVARLGARSVTGVEVDASRVQEARDGIAARDLAIVPDFRIATDTARIPLETASADVILCFDVLEHVLDIEAIVPEWRRVLRPGGRILIWWMPWLHPWGHHVESLVSIPWAHVVFSEKTVLETCARIYDLPEFRPRMWDLDADGRKKPNKWRALDRLPDLNRLTIRAFERLCRRAGLLVERRDIHGFGSSRAARLTNVFTRLPWLREFFAGSVVYRLRSP